jgi:hypothetical protein
VQLREGESERQRAPCAQLASAPELPLWQSTNDKWFDAHSARYHVPLLWQLQASCIPWEYIALPMERRMLLPGCCWYMTDMLV